MNTIVICTPKDPVRFENVHKQFKHQSFKYTEHELFMMPALMYPDQPSVGIKRSFCQAIRYAKIKGWEEVVIFEDDVNMLHPESLRMFFDIWNEHKPDGILLGGIYEGILIKTEGEKIAQIQRKFSGLHATIIPQSLYNKLLTAEEPYNLDHWISMKSGIHSYVCDPMLIMQNDGYSYNAKEVTQYGKYIHMKYNLINKINENKT